MRKIALLLVCLLALSGCEKEEVTVCYDYPADHLHGPAAEPQTVEDPVSGYCGNMLTTVSLNGESYTFDGADSVALTDILINLDYDAMKICRCAAEFTVETESGGEYGINLTHSYARCDAGQADLTAEQVQTVEKIIESLGK